MGELNEKDKTTNTYVHGNMHFEFRGKCDKCGEMNIFIYYEEREDCYECRCCGNILIRDIK
jgi:hypothetical protein